MVQSSTIREDFGLHDSDVGCGDAHEIISQETFMMSGDRINTRKSCSKRD